MKKLLLIIALTIFGLGLNAQNVGDVTYIDYGSYSLKFEITSVSPAECKVSDLIGYPGEVTIPSTVTISRTEYSVTSIGDWAFNNCYGLTSIEIPNSVTSIGNSAFSDCYGLTSIEIPNSVTSIGYRAFYDCTGLKNFTFGDNPQLTSIGDYAFAYSQHCYSGLTSIEIPNSVTSIGDYAFSVSHIGSIEISNSVTSIGYAAFYDCAGLTSITFGDNPQLTSIGDYTFYCTSLRSIEIPNSVTSIGDYAFYDCNDLTSIEIPNSVTSIGYAAFYDCTSLTSITFGDNPQLTSIGDYAFCVGEYNVEDSSLTSIEIPNSVTSIGDYAFCECSSLTSITFGDNPQLTSIGDNAFWRCSSLTSIEIPNSVTFIGEGAFYRCSSLTSITFGDNPQLTSIEHTAFYGCESLTSIEIPNSVTSIGDYAFYECTALESIEIPNSVTSIGSHAFYNCTKLRNIICYAEDVPETGDYYVFGNCRDMIIYVPEVSLEDYKATYPWNEFTILPLNDEENDPLDAPENLVAEVLSTSSIILTWDNVENALSYNVYQANELIANVEETTFTVDGLEYNTEYCYTVTAVRNETESDKSEEVCAKTLGESINELLFSSINIYPNPVEDELFIATEVRVKEIAIYDVYGRQTMSLQVNETTSQQVVKVAELEAGVYFMKVVTNEGEIVKRFVKK